jgi:hypothetical protein
MGGNLSRDEFKSGQEQLDEEEEEELLDRFYGVAAEKLGRMDRQSEETGIEFQHGVKESLVIDQMQDMGLYEGIAAGVLTFIILRRGPLIIGRYVQKSRMQQENSIRNTGFSNSSYQLSDPNPTNRLQQTLNPKYPRPRNVFLRGIWFCFDATVSLIVAASVTSMYTITEQLRNQIAELPLIEGRSLVAESLCDDLAAELQAVQAEGNRAYRRLRKRDAQNEDHAAFYMEGVEKFVENCQRRNAMERRLRQEQGLGPHDHVEILPPGVPRDGPRLLANSDGVEQDEDYSIYDLRHDYESPDADWASNFVTDQEDHDRKEGR